MIAIWANIVRDYYKRLRRRCFFREFCELFKNTYFIEDLRTAGSETPIRESLFKKVASLTTRTHLTVLERDSSTGISLWILRNFLESFFSEHLPATTSYMMLFFFFLSADQQGLQSKTNLLVWCNGKFGERIHKPVQFCVVMGIRWKPHCQVVATHVPT